MKKSLSILGCLLISATSYAEQKPYTLDFSENPPFTMNENGKASGVAINVISKLFEKAKVPFKLQSVPLARGMAEAKAQDLTCVFPVQRSQANEADYLWVSPIFITNSGLFVHPDSKEKFVALVDAKKLKIGALRGSGDAEYLKAFGYTIEEANTQEQNLEKLLNKRIDVWATDVLSAKYFVQKSSSKNKMPKEALTFRRSLGSLACNAKMAKADVAKLQDALDAMIKNGSLEKMTAATP